MEIYQLSKELVKDIYEHSLKMNFLFNH